MSAGNTNQTPVYVWWSPDGVNMVPASAANPLPVNATVTATAETVAVATAAPPTYTEGSTDSLSMDLNGNLRIAGTISASTTANASATAPTYTTGAEPLSQNLTGDLRTIAKQNGSWVVGIDQTTPGTTNAVDITNLPLTVDVNTGNATNSTLRVVLASNQPTVAVSAASLPLPSGAATDAHLTNVQSAPGTSATTAITVQGSASGVAMPVAGSVTVSGTVSAAQSGTWTVGISASQTIGVTQATAANLNATVVGTGTFAVQAAQSGTWNITNISGAISLPTGAATSALQTTGNTSLATIASGYGATGSAVPSDAAFKGLLAKTSNPSAATDGNLVGAMADKLGRQVVVIGNVRDNKGVTVTNLASSSSTTVVAAQGSGVFADIYGFIASNSTASAVTLSLSDGTNSIPLEVPADDTRGFMLPSSDGLKATTANTAWTVSGGASGVGITALWVKNL